MPKPTLSFLIPSLKDQEKLECRVYIPPHLLRFETPTPPTTHSKNSTEDGPAGTRTRKPTLSGLGSAPCLDKDVSRKKAAIIAHPYPALGGSFDDHVVSETTKILLEHGFIVGTFNFRGAGQSRGHTSWSAKPEVSDYMAFVGFMATFLTYLDIHPKPSSRSDPQSFDDHGLATITSQAQLDTPWSSTASTPISPRGSTIDTNGTAPMYDGDKTPLIIMAGYSYGSLIAQLLPSLPEILSAFAQPAVRTPTSEIRFRAREMADVQNRAHFDRLAHEHEYMARHTIDKTGAGIRVGSDEDGRKARDDLHHRLSLPLERLEHHEWARKSVDRVRSIRHSIDALSPTRKPHQGLIRDDMEASNKGADDIEKSFPRPSSVVEASASSDPVTNPVPEPPTAGPAVLSMDDAKMFSDPVFRAQLRHDTSLQRKIQVEPGTLLPNLAFQLTPAYLLISPIQGAIGGLVTMFATTSHHALLPSIPFMKKKDKQHKLTKGELNLVQHPTLAVFGSSDGFSSIGMMRKWSQALTLAPGSAFQVVEIKGAGHFWHEHAHLEDLRMSVRQWIAEIE